MSYSTVLAVTPDRRPVALAELRNAWGWSPSIWDRLVRHNGLGDRWDLASPLWRMIDDLPEWQQAPLVLTFDTGVIPWQAFGWAAEMLDEFESRLPAPVGHVNHIPAMAELLRSRPESPFVGIWGTSVTDSPFDPWDEEADDYGSGIPLSEMYLLPQHRMTSLSPPEGREPSR